LIIDLEKFLARERPAWGELEQTLRRMDGGGKLDLAQARRLHYLYERASSALGRVQTFSGDPETREYLESLVARAYGLIHSADRPRRRLRPIHWFIVTFPRTFRRHFGSFLLATAATLVGALFGGVAVAADEEAKSIILPFEHLMGDPSDRVAQEEQTGGAEGGGHSTFAAMLIQNNVRVSFMALALGFTFGIGTILLLFYNGVILGAVCFDYIRAGEGVFLAGWLLPHGSIEIPAILLAGQAGMVLGRALIGHGDRNPLKARMRLVSADLVTLIGGVAVLLVWAGIIESFVSQFHEPRLPYWLKISFGVIELGLLGFLLGRCGRKAGERAA